MKPKVVPIDPPVSAPPRSFQGEARSALWQRVQSSYLIGDVGGIELLLLACETTDRAAALRAAIDADGVTLISASGAMREHPGLRARAGLPGFSGKDAAASRTGRRANAAHRPTGWADCGVASMVTKRTPLARPAATRITSEAIELFRRRDWLGLHRELLLKPWQRSPLDAAGGPRPAWVRFEDWDRARALRRAACGGGCDMTSRRF